MRKSSTAVVLSREVARTREACRCALLIMGNRYIFESPWIQEFNEQYRLELLLKFNETVCTFDLR